MQEAIRKAQSGDSSEGVVQRVLREHRGEETVVQRTIREKQQYLEPYGGLGGMETEGGQISDVGGAPGVVSNPSLAPMNKAFEGVEAVAKQGEGAIRGATEAFKHQYSLYGDIGPRAEMDVLSDEAIEAEFNARLEAARKGDYSWLPPEERDYAKEMADYYWENGGTGRSKHDLQTGFGPFNRENIRADLGISPNNQPKLSPIGQSSAEFTKAHQEAAGRLTPAPRHAETFGEYAGQVVGDVGAYATQMAIAGKAGIPGKSVPGQMAQFGAIEGLKYRDPGAALSGAAVGGSLGVGGQVAGPLGAGVGGAGITAVQGGGPREIATMGLLPLATAGVGRAGRYVEGKFRPGRPPKTIEMTPKQAKKSSRVPDHKQFADLDPVVYQSLGLKKSPLDSWRDHPTNQQVRKVSEWSEGQLNREIDAYREGRQPDPTWALAAVNERIHRQHGASTGETGQLGSPIDPATRTPHGTVRDMVKASQQPGAQLPKQTADKTEIAEFLGERFGVPVRKGKFRQKALGIYKLKEAVVRDKKHRDILTLSHEVGHFIQHRVLDWPKSKKRMPADVKAELIAAGKALYGKRKPPGGYASEGVAEYFAWRMGTGKHAAEMPKFHNWLTEKLGQWTGKRHSDAKPIDGAYIEESLDAATQMFQNYWNMGAAQRVRESTGIPKKKGRWGKFIEHTLDPHRVPHLLSKMQEIRTGKKPLPTKDAAELMDFAALKGPQQVKYQMIGKQTNWVGDEIGPSMADIIKVSGDYSTFNDWIKANRTLVGERRGREMGVGEAGDAKAYLESLPPEVHAKMREANELYQKFMQNELFNAVDAGVVPADHAARMIEFWEGYYIPFVRVLEPYEGVGMKRMGRGRSVAEPGPATRAFVGDTRKTLPLWEATAQRVSEMRRATMLRRIQNALIDQVSHPLMGDFADRVAKRTEKKTVYLEEIRDELIKEMPDLAEVLESAPDAALQYWRAVNKPGKNEILRRNPDGTFTAWDINPELMEAVSYDPRNAHAIIRAMSKLSYIKRLGATGLSIPFGAVNAVRDMMTYMIYTDAPWITTNWKKSAPAQLIKGYWDTATNRQTAKTFKAMGGEVSTLTGIDPTFHIEAQQHAVQSTSMRKALSIVRHPLEALSIAMETTRKVVTVPETAPRSGEFNTTYESMRRQGLSHEDARVAAFNAGQDITVNFSRMGRSMRDVNSIWAFSNASVQGPNTFARQFKRNPTRMMRRMAALTAMSVGYWWKVKDEDWWKDQPAWLKYGFLSWKFSEDGRIYRLPIPHTIGAITHTMAVGIADSIYRKDPDKIMEALAETYEREAPPFFPGNPAEHGVKGMVMQPVGNISGLGPAIEVSANYKGFQQRPISGVGELNKSPQERYNHYTTEMAKWLSKKMGDNPTLRKLGISPKDIDHFNEGLTGGLGLEMVQFVEKATGMRKDRPGGLEQWPVISRFMVREESASKYPDQWWDTYSELSRRFNSDLIQPATPEFRDYHRMRRDKKFIEYWSEKYEKAETRTDALESWQKIVAKMKQSVQSLETVPQE